MSNLSCSLHAEKAGRRLDEEGALKEISALKEALHQQAGTLNEKHFQELNAEKEKTLRLQASLSTKQEADRADAEARHALVILIY